MRVPVTGDAVGPDGTIADPHIREQVAAAVTALANTLRAATQKTPLGETPQAAHADLIA